MNEHTASGLGNWFLLGDVPPSMLVAGGYDYWLVVLSVVIATASSCAALQLAGHARQAATRANRYVALAAGSAALGAGVWAMHFIGMLAFQLCAEVHYSPGITLASMIPSLAASWIALGLLGRRHIDAKQLIIGGVLVGAGIGAMHYGGMLAMRMSPQLVFDPAWFAASIGVAVVLAMLALWIRFGLVHSRYVSNGFVIGLGGLVMGLAISGMHYTGMQAARFVGPTDPNFQPGFGDHSVLALSIALVAVAIGALAIGGNALLHYYQLHQRLSESEARMRAIVGTAVDGIISIDQHGRILSFNASAERIFGWRADEIMGHNVSRLMNGQDRAIHNATDGNFLDTGMAKMIGSGREVVGMHRNGTAVPMRLAISKTDVRGEPLFFGIVTDISERKAIEEELRNREDQYRTLIANIPGVTFRYSMGADSRMIFASEAVEALTGWPASALIGGEIHFPDLMYPEERTRVMEVVQEALDNNRSYTVEYRVRRRDGGERWVSTTASGVRDAAGQLQWIDGVMLDVTEARLRNAEFETVATALDRALAVLEVDSKGTIVRANDNMLAMTGYTRDELVGLPHLGLCPPGYADTPEYAANNQALLRGEVVSDEFLRLGKPGRAGGREFWMQATYNPVIDHAGQVRSFMAFATDITQRKTMERELREAKSRAEQAAAARSSFLANMSHEIRTPMNAILGFTDVLLNTTLAPAQRRHLDTVRHAAQSLLGLLNDILDTAKLEKGAVELEMADFSLRGLCEQVAASMRLGAEKKGLALKLDYPQELPEHFRGDALRIQQVLVNLLGNAIKFTHQGKVVIEVRQQQSSTVIAVVDTGIGIPADRLERIFDAFAQADATITRQYGGTGLGTTIARQLTELMGGRIVVQSEPGVGSRFEMRIPLACGQAPLQASAEERPRLPPLTILVADDVPQNVELLDLVLQGDGHTVRSAKNGVEALRLFNSGRFDVILMDMHMPEMDGMSATRALRDIERADGRVATPVIALTASVQAADRHAALQAGMDGFATKPVVVAQLYAEIARVLDLQLAPVAEAAAAQADQVIDWKQGLALWQKTERLQGAIASFLQSQAGMPGTLRDALAMGDREELAMLAHKVSGASGNLALVRLRAAAHALEQAAKAAASAEDPGSMATDVDAVIAELHAVATQLPKSAQAPQQPAVVQAEVAAIDSQALLKSLAQLRDSLVRSGLDEVALQQLTDALPASRLAALLDAIDQFDFQGAVRHVEALQEALAPEATTTT